MERLFAIAKITRAAGLKGDVRLQPISRYFSDYVAEHPLFLGFSNDLAREIQLDGTIGMGKRVRYHFKGIDTRDDAEAIIGQILFVNVNEEDIINLSSEELIGYDVVTNSGEQIGVLVDILTLPANDVYVIESGNREILIPAIPEIIVDINDQETVVTIAPMDGLLD
ncbi:MAG: ribosome maturation factor RimM [Candidatus Neomarinimicrobiota bacterium]